MTYGNIAEDEEVRNEFLRRLLSEKHGIEAPRMSYDVDEVIQVYGFRTNEEFNSATGRVIFEEKFNSPANEEEEPGRATLEDKQDIAMEGNVQGTYTEEELNPSNFSTITFESGGEVITVNLDTIVNTSDGIDEVEKLRILRYIKEVQALKKEEEARELADNIKATQDQASQQSEEFDREFDDMLDKQRKDFARDFEKQVLRGSAGTERSGRPVARETDMDMHRVPERERVSEEGAFAMASQPRAAGAMQRDLSEKDSVQVQQPHSTANDGKGFDNSDDTRFKGGLGEDRFAEITKRDTDYFQINGGGELSEGITSLGLSPEAQDLMDHPTSRKSQEFLSSLQDDGYELKGNTNKEKLLNYTVDRYKAFGFQDSDIDFGTVDKARTNPNEVSSQRVVAYPNKEATGFKFLGYDAQSMVNEIKNAIWTYYDRKDDFKNILKNCINARFSWEDSAMKYKFLYLDVLNKKNF